MKLLAWNLKKCQDHESQGKAKELFWIKWVAACDSETGSFCYKRHCWDNPWNLHGVSASDFYSFNVGVWRNVWMWGKYILLYLGMMHQVGNFFSNGPGRKVLCVSGCAGVHYVSIFLTMHSGTWCWQLGTGCGRSIYTTEISKCCNSGHFLHWRANPNSDSKPQSLFSFLPFNICIFPLQ